MSAPGPDRAGLVLHALELRRQDREDEAIPLLRDALADGEGSPLIAAELGRCLIAAGDADGALVALRSARRRRPRDADVCHLMGVAYSLRFDDVRAARCYRRALELDAGHDGARFNLQRLLRLRSIAQREA